MARTFEEIATPELDALYQGAMFLSGGEAAGAEYLVVEAVTLAFKEHATDDRVEDVQRWFEARLARSFLRAVHEGATEAPPPAVVIQGVAPTAFMDLGSQDLFLAAATIPAHPRAALWLVLLRRWSYADAARVIGVDESDMPDLLAWRDALMRELVSPGAGDRTGEMS